MIRPDGDKAETTKKVLIVEDDRGLRRGVARILAARGYDVVEAESVMVAMTLARRGRPDVVLLDLRLPDGEGTTVLERFEHMPDLSHVRVVVLTGVDRHVAETSLQRFPDVQLLIKPVDHIVLMRAIEQALLRTPPPTTTHDGTLGPDSIEPMSG